MAAVDLSAVIPGALGVSIDIASGAEVDALGKSIAGKLPPDLHPQVIPLDASSAVPAGGAAPLVLNLSGPKRGKIWSVRKLVLVGTDTVSAVANVTGSVYATMGGRGGYAVTDIEYTGLTVPSSTLFSSGQLTVRGGNELLVVLFGAGVVAGQPFTVSGSALEIDDDPRWLAIF